MTIQQLIERFHAKQRELRLLEARDAKEAREAALRAVWMNARWDRALGEGRH